MTLSPLALARKLGPSFAERSEAIEQARRLPDDVAADLVASGLCKLLVPAGYGGQEADPATALAVIEELAYHDAAVGWCEMIAATTGLLAAFTAPGPAAAVFGPDGAVAVGRVTAQGEAVPGADGGLVATGEWQWGSFAHHATTIAAGCRVAGGPPRMLLFRRDQVELIDTWFASGLEGTGSGDYRVTAAHVPEGYWADLTAAPLVEGALYRFPIFGMLALGIAAVALGVARRALDEVVALAAVKQPQGSSRPLADRAVVQADLAKAEASMRSARAWLDDVVAAAWREAVEGAISVEARRLLRLACTHAVTASAATVDAAYTTGGGASVYRSHPLQRAFRDVHVATQHAMVAPRTYELPGRLLLGLDTDTAQL